MIGPGLHIRQRQGLAMTPRLAQSIRMIGMGTAELDALVASTVERNPFLRRDPRSLPRGVVARGGGDPLPSIEERAAAPVTLVDAIERQVALAFRDAEGAALARRLAAELDEAGYLREGADALARRFGVPRDRLVAVLDRCRAFEPAGLFARDLADCIGLQLASRDRLDPAMARLLSRLDLLARRDFAALREVTGLEEADLLDALAEIRGCDPKPAAGFAAPVAATLAPCARIVAGDGGGWRVALIGSEMPRVLVDRDAAEELARHDDTDAREWIASHLAEASWLARSLAQRARSIRAVVAEAARRQSDFLVHGEARLRPLTRRAVADAIGVHESTVSRAVSGKSVETPLGTLPLARFFGAGVPADDGALAARAVQSRIAELIGAERPEAILSDERLTGLLREEGIDIARRTVAKYREALSIGSSAQRRRERRARDTVERARDAGERVRDAGERARAPTERDMPRRIDPSLAARKVKSSLDRAAER